MAQRNCDRASKRRHSPCAGTPRDVHLTFLPLSFLLLNLSLYLSSQHFIFTLLFSSEMFSSGGPRRSSISPFRSRKSPSQPPPPGKPAGRPLTPSSTASSRPASRLSPSPTTSTTPSPSPPTIALDPPETSKSKENVMVTVRFRPLRFLL